MPRQTEYTITNGFSIYKLNDWTGYRITGLIKRNEKISGSLVIGEIIVSKKNRSIGDKTRR
jgi:hypothetical protein